MRFCNVAFVLLSGLAIASAAAPYQNAWTASADKTTYTVVPGEAATCPAATDMFPIKVKNVGAQFTVEYFNHYKIVNNTKAGTRYVLVQRGCTAPTFSASDLITATFTIPLTSVALTSSSYFPVFHYMGEKQAARLYTSNVMYSDDACMQKQAADGHTLTNPASYPFSLSYDGTNYISTKTVDGVTTKNSHTALDDLNIESTFGGDFCSGKNCIKISDTTEESFYTVGEWFEYVATFFNKEGKVVTLADTAQKRWKFESNGINNSPTRFNALKIQKKVLLVGGYHQGVSWYYNGWMMPPCKKTGVCPVAGSAADAKCGAERWCELVRDAGGDIMNMNLPATWTDSQYGGGSKEGISHAQLITFAKDADIVIFKSAADTAVNMKALLANMTGIKAVDDKMVFDNQAKLDHNKGNAIFGHGQIEPDVMLQDIIKMIDPTYNHKQVFFRNMFTGGNDGKEAMGNDITCANKPAQAGCIPTLADTLAKCIDPSATDDVLTYLPDGYYVPAATPAPVVVAAAVAKETIYFVTLTVTMPYTKAEFEVEAVKNSYKAGVAAAAGTISANVEILGVVETRRRAGSVAVETKILAADAAGVTTLSSTLGSGKALMTKLNAALKAEGVKESTGVTDPVANAALDSAASSCGVPQAIIGAAVVLAVLLG